MSRVKCVLFDVDGTLIDAARNQREAVPHILASATDTGRDTEA